MHDDCASVTKMLDADFLGEGPGQDAPIALNQAKCGYHKVKHVKKKLVKEKDRFKQKITQEFFSERKNEHQALLNAEKTAEGELAEVRKAFQETKKKGEVGSAL